jgi:hypothetical protein
VVPISAQTLSILTVAFYTKKARNPFLLCPQGSIIESAVCKIGKGKYQLWNRSRGF